MTAVANPPPAPTALFETRLNLPGRRQGKVRDVYSLPTWGAGAKGGRDALLIVASDRLSAFDVVMPTPIPGKGRLLTEISTGWFRFVERHGLAKTHVLSTDVRDVPDSAFRGPGPTTTREELHGRITIARACRVVLIECVVRGFLEGSGWKDYQATGAVCGVKLPAGLKQCDRLPEPIFTPATKAPQGQHDENITFERAAAEVGRDRMAWLRERSLAIFNAAAAHALSRGIIIADTKFEFGVPLDDPSGGGGDPILIDEALTPDSSRFWPADRYVPGRAQPSYDKQFLREHLQALVDAGRWNKQPPGPTIPADVVQKTLAKYAEARDRLAAG
ncbi:MAG: phosphoribosylaminoimidazolesuccinocarboxamide synthase [Phycisphaerales bacterium]